MKLLIRKQFHFVKSFTASGDREREEDVVVMEGGVASKQAGVNCSWQWVKNSHTAKTFAQKQKNNKQKCVKKGKRERERETGGRKITTAENNKSNVKMPSVEQQQQQQHLNSSWANGIAKKAEWDREWEGKIEGEMKCWCEDLINEIGVWLKTQKPNEIHLINFCCLLPPSHFPRLHPCLAAPPPGSRRQNMQAAQQQQQ